jgi:hypothetical protein
MTLVSSDVSTKPVDQHAKLRGRHRSWWRPRWLQRRQEAEELARWTRKVVERWNDTLDGSGLTHHTFTAARIPHMRVPQVQSVDPGPPVTLLVHMLPGQVVGDFQNRADRIAAGMDVPMVHIMNCGHGLINVALLDHKPRTRVSDFRCN